MTEFRLLGRTGIEVGVLGLGGAQMAFDDTPDDVVTSIIGAVTANPSY